ncbi:Hypothetical predicted protein, partial [Paramuricea clavata]
PSPISYNKAKEDLESFIAECPEHQSLSTWLDWWHKKRAFVFPAFISVCGGPKMNLAEVIHATWVKRDHRNMSLLDAAHADARDNNQLKSNTKLFTWEIHEVEQESSEILQRVSLTIEEIRHITANTPANIPEQLKAMDEANTPTQQRQSREDITTNLLENDPCNSSLQMWYLE